MNREMLFNEISLELSILFRARSVSAVILLIADLDRVSAGLVKVSQKPMTELQQKLSTLAY
jgi:hypothetical protein